MKEYLSINKNRIVAIIIALLPILLSYMLFPDFMGDDAFIHLGFVKGLIASGKFSYAGNVTYGTTSPMWVIMGFIFSKIFSNPEISIRILCAIFTFLTVYIFYLTLLDENINKNIVFVALLSLIFNPFLLKWAISGMEASAAASILLILYRLNKKELTRLSSFIIGAVFGISILLRPEFMAFFVLVLVFDYFFYPYARRRLFYIAIPCFVIIFTWLYYAYSQFGTIVPNTYVAKAGGGLIEPEYKGFVRDLKVLIAGNLPEFFLTGILVIYISILLIIKKDFKSILKKYFISLTSNQILLILLWTIGFYGFYIMKDVTIISRYSLVLVPPIILFAAVTFNFFSRNFTVKATRLVLSLYVVIIITAYGYITLNVVMPSNNNFVKGFQQTYREISTIIRNNSEGKNVSVAASDVGIIGCYSGARIDDLGGLVDRTRFNYKSNAEYVSNKKPDFIILRGESNISNILPKNAGYKILYEKKIPGFAINDPAPRSVSLYKIIYYGK